jgi:23S rRNA (uracil1939-C5)-methyltransferase
MANGGRGVAHHDGRVWFVKGAIAGDRLWARVERERSNFVEAVAGKREVSSPDRREAPCPVQGTCGGCPWMTLDETAQSDWKRRLVVDALERIGRISSPNVEPVRRPSPTLGYRNRVEFSAGAGPDGRAAIGLWGEVDGRRGIIDVEACPLQASDADGLLARIRKFVAHRPEVGREFVDKGPFRILIRSTSGTHRLVGLWGAKHPFPAAEELAGELAREFGPTLSVVRLTAHPGRRGGVRSKTLHGSATLADRIGDLEFELSPASFVQVNPAGGNELISLVLEFAENVKRRSVLDLFGGAGAFGLHLAKAGAESVVVCDADRAAIEAGRRTAWASKVTGVSFAHRTAQAYLRSNPERPNLVVANPPRTGFGKGVAAKILALAPYRVIVVSCDPPTLARDLRPFLEQGYRLDRVVPVDLFPQTPHVETVVRLTATAPRRPQRAESPPQASDSD